MNSFAPHRPAKPAGGFSSREIWACVSFVTLLGSALMNIAAFVKGHSVEIYFMTGVPAGIVMFFVLRQLMNIPAFANNSHRLYSMSMSLVFFVLLGVRFIEGPDAMTNVTAGTPSTLNAVIIAVAVMSVLNLVRALVKQTAFDNANGKDGAFSRFLEKVVIAFPRTSLKPNYGMKPHLEVLACLSCALTAAYFFMLHASDNAMTDNFMRWGLVGGIILTILFSPLIFSASETSHKFRLAFFIHKKRRELHAMNVLFVVAALLSVLAVNPESLPYLTAGALMVAVFAVFTSFYNMLLCKFAK